MIYVVHAGRERSGKNKNKNTEFSLSFFFFSEHTRRGHPHTVINISMIQKHPSQAN